MRINDLLQDLLYKIPNNYELNNNSSSNNTITTITNNNNNHSTASTTTLITATLINTRLFDNNYILYEMLENNVTQKIQETSAKSIHWYNLLLILIIVITICGNSLVVLAVLKNKVLQTTTNYFLMSLAIADFLVAIVVMPLSMIIELLDYFPFGYLICNFWVTSDVLLCTSSIWHMCIISMDRFFTIRFPFKYGRYKTRKYMFLKIVVVWLLSIVICSPMFILGLINPNYVFDDKSLVCALQHSQYKVYGSILAFYIPLIIIGITYTFTMKSLQHLMNTKEKSTNPSDNSCFKSIYNSICTYVNTVNDQASDESTKRTPKNSTDAGSCRYNSVTATLLLKNGSIVSHRQNSANENAISSELEKGLMCITLKSNEPNELELDYKKVTKKNRSQSYHSGRYFLGRTSSDQSKCSKSPKTSYTLLIPYETYNKNKKSNNEQQTDNTANFINHKKEIFISETSLHLKTPALTYKPSIKSGNIEAETNMVNVDESTVNNNKNNNEKEIPIEIITHVKIDSKSENDLQQIIPKHSIQFSPFHKTHHLSLFTMSEIKQYSKFKTPLDRSSTFKRSKSSKQRKAKTLLGSKKSRYSFSSRGSSLRRSKDKIKETRRLQRALSAIEHEMDNILRTNEIDRCNEVKIKSQYLTCNQTNKLSFNSIEDSNNFCSSSRKLLSTVNLKSHETINTASNSYNTNNLCVFSKKTSFVSDQYSSELYNVRKSIISNASSYAADNETSQCSVRCSSDSNYNNNNNNENNKNKPNRRRKRFSSIRQNRHPSTSGSIYSTTTSSLTSSNKFQLPYGNKPFKSKLMMLSMNNKSASKYNTYQLQTRFFKANNERKAVKVLIIIFVIFVVLWTPFFVFNIISAFCPSCEFISAGLMDFCTWLGYISSMANPIIYTVFNKSFRKAFIDLLTCKTKYNNIKRKKLLLHRIYMHRHSSNQSRK